MMGPPDHPTEAQGPSPPDESVTSDADRGLVTILFTDIVGSTRRAAELGDSAWGALLEQHNVAVRTELARFRGEEVNTAGDGFLVMFDRPERAVRCALAMTAAVRRVGLEIRSGMHAGEMHVAGEDVTGIAVHIGARVAMKAAPGEVLVSSTVHDLVAGSGLSFVDRGEYELKGVPGSCRIYAVVDA